MDRVFPRFRFLRVSADQILWMLNWKVSQAGYVRLPEMPDMPKDAQVLAAHYDFSSNCFVLKVYHHTFPELDEASMGRIIEPELASLRQRVVQVQPSVEAV